MILKRLPLLLNWLIFSSVFAYFVVGNSFANSLKPSEHLLKMMDVSDTVHFLNRVAFGAEPQSLIKYLGKSRNAAINDILSGIRKTPVTPPPDWTYDQAPPFWGRTDMVRGDQNLFDTTRTKEFESLKQWWVTELAQTESPLTERLVLFWHNHFVAAYAGIDRWSISLIRQNQTFRKFGSGSFKTLLTRSLKEPALLKYLDADKNKKGKPNENLGRELLELFTLGEGEYSERDVKEVSRALTGWRTSKFKNLSFRNDKWAHDKGSKIIFGGTGFYSQEDLINLLLKHPRTSQFITEKFWKYFVSETWDDSETIKQIAENFRKSGYDLRVLLKKMLESKAFWSPKARGSIIKSPVDFVLGTIRSLRVSPENFKKTPQVLKNMGQELFNPPNVGGWPRFRSWVTPSGLIERAKYAQNLIAEGGVTSETDKINKIKRYFGFIKDQHPLSLKSNPSKPVENDQNVFKSDYMLSAYASGFGMKRRPNFTIGFINARVNNASWGTLGVGFDVSKGKGFRIKFREHKCYPRCFTYSNVGPQRKRRKGLNIYLTDSSRRVFKKIRHFSHDEKKMVAIVAGSLDVIADLTSSGRRYERYQKNRDWADYLREISPKFKNKRWIKEILKKDYALISNHGYIPRKRGMGMMLGRAGSFEGVMPGGYSPIYNPKSLKDAYPQTFAGLNLIDYLLVLPQEFSGSPNDLLAILTSPAYNVR